MIRIYFLNGIIFIKENNLRESAGQGMARGASGNAFIRLLAHSSLTTSQLCSQRSFSGSLPVHTTFGANKEKEPIF